MIDSFYPQFASNPDTEQDVLTATEEKIASPWYVILYNDDVHDMEEVMYQLMLATGKDAETAMKIMLEAHHNGKANAFEGTFEDCFKVQAILQEIALITEIRG